MNAKLLSLIGLGLAAPLGLQAGLNPDAFLLKADVIKTQADQSVVATGRASVTAKSGMRFTAERITFNELARTFVLSGDVIVHLADGSTLRAKELTIDVNDKRVVMLGAGDIHLFPDASLAIPEPVSLEFGREFPKTERDIRRFETKP
jgi:lipopolysaccharide assembly outer membrane protein LptD (OstA)